jgi:hypothetical protein
MEASLVGHTRARAAGGVRNIDDLISKVFRLKFARARIDC